MLARNCHFFPNEGTKGSEAALRSRPLEETMRAFHQFASASLVGLFGAMLIIASHLFAEYRSTKRPSFTIAVTRSLGVPINERGM